jgi:hypothetical protein
MTDKPAKPAKAAKPENIKAESPALTDKVAADAAAAAANALSVTVTKADAVAVSSLSSRVTALEGAITAELTSRIAEQGVPITGLNNTLGDTSSSVTAPLLLSTGRVRPFSVGLLALHAERWRVIEDKGRTAESDDLYVAGELVQAGACYAAIAAGGSGIKARAAWPFDLNTFKPGESTRDLIKAGQFIVAELDRRARLGDPALPAL